jgi:hypothetical protein
MLGSGLGCQHDVAIVASVCGALCNETRDPNDYSGMDCAIAARIRLLAVEGATIQDRCINLQPVGNVPSAYRLADLFDTGASAARLLALGHDPGVPFLVEISLYAPGSQPCQDGQPLVGLGRSGIVHLSRDSGNIAVPIGCRDACETHGNVQAQLLSLEDTMTVVATPPDLTLGEIFPYEALTATQGVCMAPPVSAHRGQFRPFAMSASGANLDGVWVVDHSAFDGCTVIAGTTNGGRQLSCLSDAATSKATLQGYVISDAHLSAVRDFNSSVHATVGALVFRVLDPADSDPNGSAIGAHVNYGLLSTLSEAEYPQDDTWAIASPTPTGTTSAGLGTAVIADASTGPYVITFSDGTTTMINAGGSDDPSSVTVVVISRVP